MTSAIYRIRTSNWRKSMGYNFTDINQSPSATQGSIRTSFSGVNLDGLAGFRTLNVSGRGLVSPSVSVTQKVGADGAWLDDIRLPERIIKVEARISTTLATYKELNGILHSGLQSLIFTDEPAITYKAIYMGSTDYVDNKWGRVITFSFLCPDPYKLGTIKTTTKAIVSAYKYPVKPVKVTATVTKAGNMVSIQCTGSPSIVLVGTVAVGDVYAVQWDTDPLVTLNGQPASQRLSIAHEYERVRWINGSLVFCGEATLSIQYQERGL